MNNNSIIELAQILTGALDENFVIKNQSAVTKVVSCLEAFNITHESYREVQNTRIIKDLQALRQNKANDQVLAKRIKNLLRKWKERLAATVPASTASHPNSPQNFSQGSSDATFFMTQQSQSPPNSQPSQQPQRLINGPTTFKNLLPKAPPATSPSFPPFLNNNVNNTNNSHIHQNGGFIESSSSQSSSTLLGKRKAQVEGNGKDIDENSNHNRRKMMKKSEFGTISSPNIPPLANSFAVNNIKPVPAVLQPQQQQLQIQNQPPPVSFHPQMPPQPQQQSAPQETSKKRGRKKGSMGIDKNLNGNAPTDFQAEIQQKIALSAGKRNKTTFELQKMLAESHQNASINASSLTNGDVVDSSSLDRVNFASSNAIAATNNKNASSSYHQKSSDYPVDGKKIKTEIKKEFVDEESTQGPQPIASSTTTRSLTIEDEIARLEAQLPPIDYEAAAREIFKDLDTVDDTGNVVECTCTWREVVTYSDELENQQQANGGTADTSDREETRHESDLVKVNGDMSEEEDDDDDETDDFCAVEDIMEKSPSPQPRSAVKSIFDPEYDANENLIEEMVRSRTKLRGDATSKVIEVKIEKDAVKSSRIESMMNNLIVPEAMPPTQHQIERVPIINYVCDEDPMCPARAHFQRDPVTHFDVEKLHNVFMPGVNGFFNGIPEDKVKHDFSKDAENIDYAERRLWKRVVPRYNFLTLDKVPKSFDDDSPLSIPPEPPLPEELDVKIKEEPDVEMSSNDTSKKADEELEFREWHEVMNVRSYNDEILTILPYVVID